MDIAEVQLDLAMLERKRGKLQAARAYRESVEHMLTPVRQNAAGFEGMLAGLETRLGKFGRP